MKVTKAIHFDFSKDADNNSNLEIDFIIKHNELLAVYVIKNKISQLLFKYKHGKDIHEQG